MLTCLTLLGTALLFATGGAYAQSLPRNCDYPDTSEGIPFEGGVLYEAPDIVAPELRRANNLISVRCYDEAADLLARYRSLHPEDHTASFIEARMLWISGNAGHAEALMQSALGEVPGFSSAKVLLTSMAIESGAMDDARRWLAELDVEAPTDLWALMGHLRVESATAPNDHSKTRLMNILGDARFPGSAREQSALLLLHNYELDVEETVSVYEQQLGFESATPYPMKATNLGRAMIERMGLPARGRKVMETVLVEPSYYRHHHLARQLIAESYLFEAAAIAPTPTAENAHLVERAREALGGNLATLAPRVKEDMDRLGAIEPFLPVLDDPAYADIRGLSLLCQAVVRLQLQVVYDALASGGDPNARCGETTAVGHLIMSTSDDMDAREQVLMALVQGVETDLNPTLSDASDAERAIGYCERTPQCAERLLGTLRDAEARWIVPSKDRR